MRAMARGARWALCWALVCVGMPAVAQQGGAPIEAGNKLLLVIPDPQPREYDVEVDRNGEIPIGRYGRLKVGGLAVDEAEKAAREALGKYIRNTTAVTLTRLDQKRLVYVTGHVGKSGFTRIEPGETVWEAIQSAGGPKPGADLERVVLARDGKEQVVSVRAFLTERAPLPELEAGDTIFVAAETTEPGAGGAAPRIEFLTEEALQDKVFVIGAVRNPGLFERSEVLTPLTAIGLAGGPDKDADLSSVRVLTRQRSDLVNLTRFLLGGPAPEVTIPKGGGGAIVFVPGRPAGTVDPLSQQIHVLGGVTQPGPKVTPGSLPLLDAIGLAGGPTAEADMTEVKVVHKGDGFTLVTTYDVEAFLDEGGLVGQVEVHPGDTVHVGRPAYEVWDNVLKFVSDIAIISAAVVIFVSLAEDDTNNAAAVGAGSNAGEGATP